jgi:hypothetical protein
MGYGDFIETSKSGDGGIDGIINEDKLGLEKINEASDGKTFLIFLYFPIARLTGPT